MFYNHFVKGFAIVFISIQCVNSDVYTFTNHVQVSSDVVFQQRYIDQFIDHFNYKSFGNHTYKQRYLIADDYWGQGKGPIFFYTGNERDIVSFQKASGLLTDLASKMGALVVFGEHRYYGTSLPFGQDSYTDAHIGFLTIEQALADYAYLIKYLKQKYKAEDAPVIAFGGSYGGQLAAYMRIKYPNLVAGSLAASASLYWLTGYGDRHGFWKSVTEQFGKHSDACVNRVKQGFADMASLSSLNKYDEITQAFKTCDPITKDTINHLYGWVRNSFTDLAMMNYPYPTNFLTPLPGYPVNTACDMILAGKTAMEGLAVGAGLFYNGTSSANNLKSLECFDIMKEFIYCADPTGCGLGNDASAWNYQACTEEMLPGGSNNVTDMFPSLPFTLQMRKDYCEKNLKVTPRNEWTALNFWTKQLKIASNIIFSNGDLDPWRDGGVLEDLSDSLKALTVVGGAHHFDLRGSHPKDPQSVIDVRQEEGSIISGWISQHWIRKAVSN